MKNILSKVMNRQFLSEKESMEFIYEIENDAGTNEQISAILATIQIRGLQLQELTGFKKALLELALKVELDATNAIDLCGTGGDGKNTFNISTTTSLILAAYGKKVIKHGNYGISSVCGSSNVAETLGFYMGSDQRQLELQLKEFNICFLHAPYFHPALSNVSSLRKNLGIPTLFNSLGPLINPCQPQFQITGTFSMELAELYRHVLNGQRESYKVMHGVHGYDELTLIDKTRILTQKSEHFKDASDYGLNTNSPSDLTGGLNVKDNAKLVHQILNGKGTQSQNHVIAANVAEALHCFNSSHSIKESIPEITAFIKSGQAAKHFKLN